MEQQAFDTAVAEAEFTATVTLARPETGNKLSAEEVRALGRTIRSLGSREDVKVVVIRALGNDFCLGRAPAPAGAAPRTAVAIRKGVAEPILDFYADIRATPVPVLAVVQGEARGFGCAMVGQCDLVVATEDARFSMPEMDVNLPPTLAISAVLGKIPPKRLLHMVYTRSPIGAAEALALGLISETAPRDHLDAAAAATLGHLTDRSRDAVCAVKEYLNTAAHLDPAAAARYAGSLISVVLASPGG